VRSQCKDHVAAAAVVILFLLGMAVYGQAPQPPSAEGLTRSEIKPAVDAVKADPNLATERTIKTLRWKAGAARNDVPGWLQWVAGLFRWFAQATRLLIWSAVIVITFILATFVVRLARAPRAEIRAEEFVAPTHVRTLDIRPETLPDDIGAAARALWDAGEHRAALALLYRGLLSRLVHVHSVPVRESTTEGDCLTLAAGHLAQSRRIYVADLVRVWQQAVYGHFAVDAAAVSRLCDDFSPALDRRESEAVPEERTA
jgi:hypothetical protein